QSLYPGVGQFSLPNLFIFDLIFLHGWVNFHCQKWVNFGLPLTVSEGVFSMEGDIVKLPELVHLVKKYNGRIMIDDAHGTGILGRDGRGTLEHFRLEDEVDLVMGTCSKSLASIGGFIAGDEEVIHYLKHHARSLMFSASLPPSLAASISTAIEIIEKEPERRQRLWENVNKMRRELKTLGFNIGKSETPIIPIIIGDNFQVFQMWKLLFDNGIFTNPVITPAVPKEQSRIRTTYMATHTDEQLDKALEIFESVGKKLNLIPG
ncbi:MAG: pyridoxal phosphate-dependent aminotransferase family protein, partial [bacterium]